MAHSDGIVGVGAVLSTGLGTLTTLTSWVQVRNISGPTAATDDIEVSHQGSDGAYKEYEPGMTEPGEMSGDAVYKKSEFSTRQQTIRTTGTYKITWPGTSSLASRGHLSDLGVETPYNDVVTIPYRIKLSGVPTYATS